MSVYNVHVHVHICAAYLARPGISRKPLTIDIHHSLSDGLQPGPICTCRSQHLVSHHTLHYTCWQLLCACATTLRTRATISCTRAAHALDMCDVRHQHHRLRSPVCHQTTPAVWPMEVQQFNAAVYLLLCQQGSNRWQVTGSGQRCHLHPDHVQSGNDEHVSSPCSAGRVGQGGGA